MIFTKTGDLILKILLSVFLEPFMINLKYPILEPGLYVISVPIGCLSDLTFRALNVLKSTKSILAEDTRNAKTLLSALEIDISQKKISSYHEHSSKLERKKVIQLIKNGESVALICDAGTPLISDPGYKLVREIIDTGLKVLSVPGVSSPIAALSVSGLPTDTFSFIGFLPASKNKKLEIMEKYKEVKSSLIIFESGKRIHKTLNLINEVYDPMTEICICRELTKKYEEIIRFKVEDFEIAIESFSSLKGEFVLIIGKNINPDLDWENLDKKIRQIKKNNTLKSTVALLAAEIKISKSLIYKRALKIFEE